MCLTPGVSTVASEACSFNPVLGPGASAFSLMPAPYFVDDVGVNKLREIRLPPWHPPWQGIRYKEMFQVLLVHDFILENTQLMLWAVRNPWPPHVPHMSECIQIILQFACQDIPFMPWTILFHLPVESVERARNKIGRELCSFSSLSAELLVFCSASSQILYLHGTLDNMQLSVDWHVLKIVGLKWIASLIVIIFALGVQGAQLKPTAFKWSDILFHGTHSLIARTNVYVILEELLVRRATCTLWTWCCLDTLHWPLGFILLAMSEWDMLNPSLETWVLVNYEFASLLFQWAITVQHSISYVVFLTILNWRVEVKHHYTCTRVLPVAVTKGWFFHHIQRVSPHYSLMMQCLFSHSQLQSEVQFYTAGHIFFCCALMQWKIPSTMGDCQWEIAGLLNLALSEWKQWTPGEYFWAIHPTASACPGVPIFLRLRYAIASSLNFPDELHSSITILKFHNFLMEMVELRPWPSWELFSCIAAVSRYLLGAFHILASFVFILKGICSRSSYYLEVYILDAFFAKLRALTVLHAEKFHWLLGLYTSCDKFATEGATVFHSHYFEWKIPWYVWPCTAISSSNWLRMQPVSDLSDLWICHTAFLFSWIISKTIDSVSVIEQISGMFRLASHYLECESKLMAPLEIVSSKDGILTYAKTVLIPWDLGGPEPILDPATGINWNCTQLPSSHLTWDPGGCTQHRLEGKPKFKEGGLSATGPLLHSWVGQCVATSGPGLLEATSSCYKYKGDGQKRWGSERTDWMAASAEAWLASCVLRVSTCSSSSF